MNLFRYMIEFGNPINKAKKRAWVISLSTNSRSSEPYRVLEGRTNNTINHITSGMQAEEDRLNKIYNKIPIELNEQGNDLYRSVREIPRNRVGKRYYGVPRGTNNLTTEVEIPRQYIKRSNLKLSVLDKQDLNLYRTANQLADVDRLLSQRYKKLNDLRL